MEQQLSDLVSDGVNLYEEERATCAIPRKRCPQCNTQSHIRTKRCHSCAFQYSTQERVVRSCKYPSDVLAQLKRKALQLKEHGYNIVILGHRCNPSRDSFTYFSTKGEAESFCERFPQVKSLWERFHSDRKRHRSRTAPVTPLSTQITHPSLDIVSSSSNSTVFSNTETTPCLSETSVSAFATPTSILSTHTTSPNASRLASLSPLSPIMTSPSSSLMSVHAPSFTASSLSIHVTHPSSDSSLYTQALTTTANTAVSIYMLCLSATCTSATCTSLPLFQMISSSVSSPSVSTLCTSLPITLSSTQTTFPSTSSIPLFTPIPLDIRTTLQTTTGTSSQTHHATSTFSSRCRKRCHCSGCSKPKCMQCTHCLNPSWKKACKDRICTHSE